MHRFLYLESVPSSRMWYMFVCFSLHVEPFFDSYLAIILTLPSWYNSKALRHLLLDIPVAFSPKP